MRVPKPFPGRSLTTSAFWERFNALPKADQLQARDAHRLWLSDPRMPGLRYKKVHAGRPIYSVRVNIKIRAVGILTGDDIVWFWIGPHDEYESLLKGI